MKSKITIIIISLIVMLCIPTVSAGLSELNIPINITFVDNNNPQISEFYLKWDGGRTDSYEWTNNTYPFTNKQISLNIYRDLNSTVVCSAESDNYKQQIDTYKNLTYKMTDMLDVCQDLANSNNLSLAMELSDAQFSHGLQTEKLADCKAELIPASEKAELYDSCNLQKSNLQTNYNTCKTDLEKKSKSGNSNLFIGGIIGAGIAWGIWGRKKEEGPSEYSEEGFA